MDKWEDNHYAIDRMYRAQVRLHHRLVALTLRRLLHHHAVDGALHEVDIVLVDVRLALALRVTVVALQVIDSPRSEGLRIDLLVAKVTGQVARAGHWAGVRVYAELQPFAVHVAGKISDARRKFCRICDQTAVGVTRLLLPLVIKKNDRVAQITQAELNHRVCRRSDFSVVY